MQRRTFVHTVAAGGLLAGAWPAAWAAPAVGQPAPAFSALDTGGQARSLAEFRGRHVVLEWVNPGCPFVQKHYGTANMQGLQRAFTARGVVWLSVNSTAPGHPDHLPPAQLAAWVMRQQAAPTATLMDESGVVGQAYGARTTPHLYIVNPQGTLVYAGGIDSIASANPADITRATNYVRQALNEALAGRPISQAVTRPYGCSVKYAA